MTTNASIHGRTIRFTTEGGSVHHMTRAAVQKRVRELESKASLRPSAIETLNRYREALDLARRNGL